jgi:glycosyltransferase involved in cell wall biosynthesis
MTNQRTTPNLISVIIPVYNREDFLAEAIDSALQQEAVELEILVIDDGSTDGTVAVAQRYGPAIRYYRQENAGPPVARNLGINMAAGEYLAFLDSDDLWPKHRSRLLLDRLAGDSALGVAMGHMQFIPVETTRSDGYEAAQQSTPAILNYNLSASLIRAASMRTVGLFDPAMRFSDDWDWFVRARDKGIVVDLLPEVTLINRRHAENLSNQRDVGNHYTLVMLKKALDRRRAEESQKG